jgi:hypothetical protein
MGAMECARRGCRSCCCDYVIQNMYVCASCVAEFREAMSGVELSRSEMSEKFEEFMDTSVHKKYGMKIIDVDEFLGINKEQSDDTWL